MQIFADYLDAISKTQTLDGLLATFSEFSEPLGVDQFAYLNFSLLEEGAPLCRNDYSQEWTNYYYEQSYYDIDPVFKSGHAASLPFSWAQSNNYSKTQQKLMSEAAEFGLVNGITIPSRTAGFKTAFITVVSDQSPKEFKNIERHSSDLLHLMSLHLDAKIAELSAPKYEIKDLTNRELECLKWAVRGKTNSEMAEIMNISDKTVEAHFSSIFKKLNVFSKTQAVVKSLTLGMVFP